MVLIGCSMADCTKYLWPQDSGAAASTVERCPCLGAQERDSLLPQQGCLHVSLMDGPGCDCSYSISERQPEGLTSSQRALTSPLPAGCCAPCSGSRAAS